MIYIKSVIKKHGWAIKDVAEKLGITRVTLCKTIVGNPTTKTLEDIARVIGASPAEFFNPLAAADEEKAQEVTCPHCGKTIKITAG